jgi:C4-dicarboxylate-specific signal transduction histidine kinase
MKRKITLVILVTSAACLIAACLALFAYQLKSFRRSFINDLSAIGEVVANNSIEHVALHENDVEEQVLASLRAKPDVVSADIIAKDGSAFAHFGEADDPAIVRQYPPENGFVFYQDYLLHSKPIVLDEERIGTLHLRSNFRSIYLSRIKLYSGILALVLLVCILLAIVISARLKLENQVKELQREISDRERAEDELADAHTQLVETSRQAGMAEVATGVLHNVGNVLNSVNVSATLVSDRVRGSKAENLLKVATLLREHADHLEVFFASDPRGKLLLDYLPNLGAHLNEERSDMLEEIELLTKNLDHIKEIVAMQQSYARVSGVVEPVAITSLADDALQINAAALNRHGVEVIRNYADVPVVAVDKHRVLQILVNLIRNAKYAMEECGQEKKQLLLGIDLTPGRCVRITVKDNGEGILPENLVRIFSHGFTTKKDGHGFGLHASALAASEMQGSLSASSDGPGTGATFTLELPLAPA